MSRTCNRAERSFSAIYDGAVAPTERAEFDTHLASCDHCREAFAGFVRAMSDLTSLRPTEPVSDAFVAQVMARVERAGTESNAGRISGVMSSPPRASWRRVATHSFAAVVGAAAAILIAPAFDGPSQGRRDRDESPVVSNSNPTAPPLESPRVTPTELPIRFVGHSAAIERNARVETIGPAFKFKAGETLRSLPSQRVELTLDESGELVLRIETDESPPPAPPPAVHELTILQVPSLVTVDRKFVTDAVDSLEQRVALGLGEIDIKKSVSSVSSLVHAAAQRARELRDRAAAAKAAADDRVQPDSPPEAAAEAVTVAVDRSPVIIQSSADQTRLAVQGSLHEIVPELISLLTDGDREVADLAADRLGTIRGELESDPLLGSLLKPLPPALEAANETGPARLGRWLRTSFGATDQTPRELTRHERWRKWWQENAIVVATGRPTADA
jgi:Putative zinc-finger